MPTVAMAAEGDNPETVDVGTFDKLKKVLTEAADAGSGDTTININNDIEVPKGETWSAVNINGYYGADIITIHGNGHKITGLNAPLFSGGFAGGSGLVIDGLTIGGAIKRGTHS